MVMEYYEKWKAVNSFFMHDMFEKEENPFNLLNKFSDTLQFNEGELWCQDIIEN